ncbi:hypothetical protein [Streptodolium elevatio]
MAAAGRQASSLSESELRDLVLDGASLPAGLEAPTAAPPIAIRRAYEDRCQPLAAMLSGGVGDERIRGHTTAAWSGGGDIAYTIVVIGTFPGGEAQSVIDAGLRALDECGSYADMGPTGVPAWHRPERVQVPPAGDFSVGVRLALPQMPESRSATGHVIVRVGDVLIAFHHFDPIGQTPPMPTPELVAAQVAHVQEVLNGQVPPTG